MKRLLIYLFAVALAGCFWSCDEDKPGDDSIFDTTPVEGSAFDQWLLYNYTYPYNMEFKYKMEDIEADMKYTLAPAEVDKSVALAKLVKYLWLEAYDEAAGIEFTRSYVPRIIHLIGSGAYNTNNTVLLGTAEGGLKITLYKVNDLNPNQVDVDDLNESYLKTMHHEFAHILHQTKNYSSDYKQITGAGYIGNEWSSNSQTLAIALSKGFVSRYARYSADEDFVEMISIFVTHNQEYWDALLAAADKKATADQEKTGKEYLLEKFEIVQHYLKNSWSIDIYELRSIIERRSKSIDKLDLLEAKG